MERRRILLAENNEKFGTGLKKQLEKNIYKVILSVSVQEAALALKSGHIDLILLDVDFADKRGLEFCRLVRKSYFIPIIFMGSAGDNEIQIKTLDCGGDDYVGRTVELKVLLARIRAHIRCYQVYRNGRMNRNELLFRQFRIDPSRHMVWKMDEDGIRQDRLHLSPIEYKLLEMFITNAGKLLTYEEIYHCIWKTDDLGDTRTVMVHVSNLRKKINYLDNDMIRTVRERVMCFWISEKGKKENVENNQLYPFERNRYYAGKMLTSSDFRAEQTYFNNKRRFINSMLYGSGIICGCNVFSLDDLSVLVESGAAIDDFGREILIQSSAVKKLSAIEGFQDIQGNEVLLCIRYQETPVQSVFAVNRESQEDSYEYNRVSEGYELFLKDILESEEDFELENDFFAANRLYESKDFYIEAAMPVTVCRGALARVCVRLKKLSDDMTPISWNGSLQLPALVTEDGRHELQISFADVILLKGQSVEQDYWVEAEGTGEEEANLVFQDERGNHSFKIQIRDINPEALVAETIGKTSLEMLNLEGKKDYIPLARLRLLRTDSAYIIDEVAEHGVKYIFAPGQEAKRRQYGDYYFKPGRVIRPKEEEKKEDSKLHEPAPVKKSGQAVATGIVEIPVGADAKRGEIYYSGEVMHGLGRGNVYVELGYEWYEDENMPGANIKSTVYGNAEFFDTEAEEISNVETAVKVLNDKGSFIVAAKLLKNMDCLVLAYRWVAILFPSGEEAWNEEDYGNKSIAAETPTVVLGIRESYYFHVKFSNMEKCSVTYELTEGGSGDITADGVYTAPRKEGVYEIRIYCTDMPVICAYAYAIVRAKKDKEKDRSSE